ncbi:MAG: amino acid permease, partial [Spirochaetota bacterium]
AFFPAVTGIDAGVGMSGSLKDPRKSLSRGTFASIGVTAAGYIAITLVFSFVRPELLKPVSGRIQTAVDIFSDVQFVPIVLLIGILFATGFSALSYFMTSPRICQTLAVDGVLPKFFYFLRKDFSKKGKEPRWAAVLTFCLVMPVIWCGDLTISSTIVGICFLVVYGWVNLAAFFERVSGNPSFRPSSWGHWGISLYGFLVCIIVISLFNIFIGLGVLISQGLIFYLLLKYKSNEKLEGVWWGLLFSFLNWGFRQMRKIIQGSRNWRPIVGIFCFADKELESIDVLDMGRKISDFKGMTMVNILLTQKVDKPVFPVPDGAQLIQAGGNEFENSIKAIIQSAAPGGFHMNTVLLPLDTRLNLISLIEDMMPMQKNVLLYKHGVITNAQANRIDVWWKGEENGNLMALFAYIISQSDVIPGRRRYNIRIIRKLEKDESPDAARLAVEQLMDGARLRGEIRILPDEAKEIHDTIRENSFDSSLILIGMPGKRVSEVAGFFSLDKVFFTRELHQFNDFPPIMFVKAAEIVDLLE